MVVSICADSAIWAQLQEKQSLRPAVPSQSLDKTPRKLNRELGEKRRARYFSQLRSNRQDRGHNQRIVVCVFVCVRRPQPRLAMGAPDGPGRYQPSGVERVLVRTRETVGKEIVLAVEGENDCKRCQGLCLLGICDLTQDTVVERRRYQQPPFQPMELHGCV